MINVPKDIALAAADLLIYLLLIGWVFWLTLRVRRAEKLVALLEKEHVLCSTQITGLDQVSRSLAARITLSESKVQRVAAKSARGG